MVQLKALRSHDNEYGDKHHKTAGAEYEAPEAAAQSLIANGLCEKVGKKAE